MGQKDFEETYPDIKKVFNAIADIIGQKEHLKIKVISIKKEKSKDKES